MNLTGLLAGLGLPALLIVAGMVVIENGLLFPFLPGDSLIFASVLLAGSLQISWLWIVALAAVSAIGGAELGFTIGRRFGRRWFRPDARILKSRYLDEADAFFHRYGPPAIVLARFVPIVRTYISPAMGASSVRRRTFSLWNAIGGISWALLLGVAGVFLGRIPFVAANIEWIALGVVVVSVLPIAVTALRRRHSNKANTP
ncbi:MAG TPA: VTT domain-containing protein [Pseudolysinimonas sp.]|jgi:membrane-associated protein